MKKLLLVFLMVLSLLLSACGFSVNISGPNLVRGSGTVASETRDLGGFTSVELAGSAEVEVTFGNEESVTVETDDNILPLVETKVEGNTLIINLKPGTSIQTNRGINVSVTMRELESASLPGSGSITISGLMRDRVRFSLPGSGNITASGEVQDVEADLAGSGQIQLRDLVAQSARVVISGSGSAEVYASNSLDATVSGSGSIRYFGDPANVNRNVTGSGSVEES